MMHSSQIEKASDKRGGHDFSNYFQHISEELKSADIAVANMEFSLGGEPFSGYPAFSAPDCIAWHMAEIGTDVFLAANNHIYDRGRSGAERTIELFRSVGKKYGTKFTGIASDHKERDSNWPLIITDKGIRIAFLNFTYATNGGRRDGWPEICYMDEREEILSALEKAREKNADIIIALPHWGNEYQLTHSNEQQEVAEWLADNGADLIIGTHPHVVQDTTILTNGITGGKTYVAYSLGNAISNMSAPNTQLELMATSRIVRHHNGDIEILPLEFTFLWCSRPGGFDDNYTVLPIKQYSDKRKLWANPWDYEKMMNTYRKVVLETGIDTKDLTDTDE